MYSGSNIRMFEYRVLEYPSQVFLYSRTRVIATDFRKFEFYRKFEYSIFIDIDIDVGIGFGIGFDFGFDFRFQCRISNIEYPIFGYRDPYERS